jgi:hypothetical protein
MTQPLVTAETKTRTPSMKWIKLGSGRDPDFEKDLFLTDGKLFYCGSLIRIEQVQNGKKYSFDVGLGSSGEPIIADYLTHYCLPVLQTKE